MLGPPASVPECYVCRCTSGWLPLPFPGRSLGLATSTDYIFNFGVVQFSILIIHLFLSATV